MKNFLKSLIPGGSASTVNDILPYIFEEDGIFLLESERQQRAMGFVFEIHPVQPSDDRVLEVCSACIESLPPGSEILFSMLAGTSRRQPPAGKATSEVLSGMAKHREAHYHALLAAQEGEGKTPLVLRDFRCIIAVSLPPAPDGADAIHAAFNARNAIESAITSLVGASYGIWSAEDMLNFLADVFDHDRLLSIAPTDGAGYDNSCSIRDQGAIHGLRAEVRKDHLLFLRGQTERENTVMQTMVAHSVPDKFFFGRDMGRLGDRLRCPYIVSLNLSVPKQGIGTKADGARMLKGRLAVTLISRSADAARMGQEARFAGLAMGLEMEMARYAQLEGILSCLPLVPPKKYNLKLDSDLAARLAPVVGGWKGTFSPTMQLFGRNGQTMNVDLFDNPNSEGSFVVAGVAGSGKTVFVADLACAHIANGDRVVLVDEGYNYKRLCESLNGKFIVVGTTKVCLNPFSRYIHRDEAFNNIRFLLAQMASPQAPLTGIQQAFLDSAIQDAWDAKHQGASITDVYELLAEQEQYQNLDAAALATMLKPFTVYGELGEYFDGDATPWSAKPLIVFEMAELRSHAALRPALAAAIMHAVHVNATRGQRHICAIGDIRSILDVDDHHYFFESMIRLGRPRGISYGAAGGGVNDFERCGVGRAFLRASFWHFLLQQQRESVIAWEKIFGEKMPGGLDSVHTDRNYAEVYIRTPYAHGIGRLVLDPFSLMLLSTRTNVVEAWRRLRRTGLTTVEVANYLVAYGVDHILPAQEEKSMEPADAAA